MNKYGGHYVGERIGSKVLTSYHGRNSHGHHLWRWRSDCCDTENGPSSISHLKRSAKCLACSYLRENNGRWKGLEELTGVWLNQRVYDAAKRGVAYTVTAPYLWELWLTQQGRCAYTGRQLYHGLDASLDRINSSLGYVIGNLQWVHRDINRMKSDFTEDVFLALCREVASKNE